MLMPKRVKFRRVQRGRLKGKASRGNTVTNGNYGLMALEPAWITSNQIEAARIAMTRYIKRGGKVWIFKGEVLPDVKKKFTTIRTDMNPARSDRRDRKPGERRGERRDGDRRPQNRGQNRGQGNRPAYQGRNNAGKEGGNK